MPTVHIVHEDVALRQFLQALAHGAGWQVDSLPSASDLLARPRPSVPACLVLDVHDLEIQQRLADRPEIPVIVMTASDDVRTAVRAMKAGAIEFLTWPFAAELLLETVSYAMERSRAALARRADLEGVRLRYASLSRRERDVMSLVVRGLLNKQVGAELGISEITVKVHRGVAMRKMNARSLPDLVNMAAKLFPGN